MTELIAVKFFKQVPGYPNLIPSLDTATILRKYRNLQDCQVGDCKRHVKIDTDGTVRGAYNSLLNSDIIGDIIGVYYQHWYRTYPYITIEISSIGYIDGYTQVNVCISRRTPGID